MEGRMITELFLKRDESALELACREYGAGLRRIALAITGDEGMAEECLNDALLEAWQRIPPNRPYDYLYAYLARIVRCGAINRMNKESAQKRSAAFTELTHELEECLPSAVNVENEVEARQLMHSVNEFLGGLSERRRGIFIRRYWFFDSEKRIAELFGISVGSVKMTLNRVRKKLLEHLEKEGLTAEQTDKPKGKSNEK